MNSRVFYRTKTSYGSSLISAAGGPDFRKWAEDWTKSNAVGACGIVGSLTNCRN